MTSPAKIVIDADNGKVDAANKKSQDEFKKTAREAGKVGSQIDKWGRQLAEKVAGLGAIIGVMRSVGQEVERQRAAAANANRAVGGGALGRSQAARDLGISGSLADSIVGGIGRATSVEQDDAFLSALAAQQKSSKGPKLKQQDLLRLIAASGSAVFSQEELLAAAGTGSAGISKLIGETGARISELSPQAAAERKARIDERTKAAEIAATLAPKGDVERQRELNEELLTAQNPGLGGFRNIVRTSSGGLSDLAETVPGVKEGATGLVESTPMVALLRVIAANTKQNPAPTMAPTTESGP